MRHSVQAQLLAALKFTSDSNAALAQLTSEEWRALLKFGDQTQLILPLNDRCGGLFPQEIRNQVDRRVASQRLRTKALQSTFLSIDDALRRAGVPYAVLKGFTHCPDFIRCLNSRAQYDIDLYSPNACRDAYEVLRQLGYEPIGGLERFPLDHLPTLVRRTGWQWRGDFFDPELPLSMEVHYRLWDCETERLHPRGLEEFWERRVIRRDHGLTFTALSTVDMLGYASLHVLRHQLRGNLKLLHVYELASFLHTHAGNNDFWNVWHQQHDPSLRRLECVSFGIASRVFGCDLPEAANELSEDVRRWLEVYGDSSVRTLLKPNKNELLLHMSLVESAADQRAVFMRRMFPMRMPGPVDAVHLPREKLTWRIQIRKRWRYLLFIATRVLHHARASVPVIFAGMSWWLGSRGISPQFLRFLAAAAVFELGLFVFYLLYSLHLLDLGFAENMVGANAGAMQAGGIAGAIPAGAASARWGLSRALSWSLAALALISILRVVVIDPTVLLVLAFSAGMLSASWMVCIAPIIAELGPDRYRPFLFSIFFSTGIFIGVLGGVLGGQLPGIAISFGARPIFAKPVALLVGCTLMCAAALLMARLRLDRRHSEEKKLYARNPLLWRFLLVVGMFSLGTGAFNSLYAVFLASIARLPVDRIGTVFAVSQFAQVIAIMLGGVAVRKLGFHTAISWSFAATAAALFWLGSEPAGLAAAGAYVVYMSFQYMSEPGIFSMLMSIATPSEHKGASTLNFLVINGAQAAAAFAAGAAVTKWGYGPVLGTAAALILAAALLFPLLTRRAASSIASTTSVR